MGRRILIWLLALAGMLLAGCSGTPGGRGAPEARQGVLRLPVVPSVPADPVALAGEWAFSWQRFESPEWAGAPPGPYIRVPQDWNEQPASGKPPGPEGWGTYRLRVDCPAGQRLALLVPSERTSLRLYANGELIASQGRPGETAASTRAAVNDRNVITRQVECPARLTAHVANYDHRAGGLVRPFLVGSTPSLAAWREARIVRETLLLGAYGLTGFVTFIFWLGRRRELLPLAFTALCLCLIVYTDIAGERLLLRLWTSELGWALAVRIEYLSRIAALSLFVLTLYGLYPERLPRRLVAAVLGLSGLAAILVLATPAGVYSAYAAAGQAISIALGAVAGWFLFRRSRRGTEVRILLLGLVAVLVSLAVDLVMLDAASTRSPVTPVGFALFLLSPAWIMGRRLGLAAYHAERSRALEESARLREDVDRISRHDLRTPLAGIVGATRLMAQDQRLAPDQQAQVTAVRDAALRALEMVNLSLGLYRMEAGTYELRPEVVDLAGVTERVLRDLGAQAESTGVTLHIEPAAEGAAMLARAEETLCYSILANLVRNAIEATPAGGEVRVTLQAGDPLRVLVHNPTEIPQGMVGRMFQKYATAGKVGGTGLGTYSARLMARAQGGEVELASRAGAGTTLVVSLPRAASSPAAVEAVPLPMPVATSPVQVLVADDDPMTRMIAERVLAQAGHEVRTVADGRAALAAAAQQWPDLVLMDAEMPVMGGLEAVRLLRETQAQAGRPACRVLLISAHDDEAHVRSAMEAGADGCLPKPLEARVLLAEAALLRPAAARPGRSVVG